MILKSFVHLFTDSSKSFEGEEEGENVILILRKHVFVIYSQLSIFGFAILIPIVFGGIFHSFLTARGLGSVAIFITGLWYMFFWVAIFYALTMYSLNVVIVTNHRIIDSEQIGFFNRKISEIHLSRVQDISVSTKGIIETMLHFGSMEVQSAGEDRQFHFYQIPNPEKVKDVIMDLVTNDHTPSVLMTRPSVDK